MYNPYENNNRPIDEVKKTSPETESAYETKQTDGEYHFHGSEIPENRSSVTPPVNNSGYSNQPYRTQPQNNGGYQYNYYRNGYQQPVSSYTWNQNPAQPSYQQNTYQPPKAPKKKSKAGKVVLSVVAVLLCCLISAGTAVGGFAYLVKDGYITVSNPGTEKTAFTITKVVDNTENVSAEGTTAGKLTTQQIAERMIPSVVCIQNYQINQQFNFFGNTVTDDSEISPAGEGSGVIMSEDGYIITNAHVVAGATSLKVITSDGETYEATMVGSDEVTDLAIIKIEATGLPAAEFGSAEDLKVGDQVVAIGNPGGSVFSSSVTVGYVSALDREIVGGEDGYTMYCIQTDAAINPGNSGGALVNEYGMVVGINSSKIVANGYEGLGFAIPSETFQPVASDLINYGYVKDRAVLGISGSFLDEMTASFYGMVPGMYVAEVVSEAAKESGLKQYDIITSIDGVDVTSSTTVTSVVSKKSPGDTVTVTVARLLENVTELELTVTLSQVEPEDTVSEDVAQGRPGFGYQD